MKENKVYINIFKASQAPGWISGLSPSYKYVQVTGMVPLVPRIPQVRVFSASDNCS